MKVFIIVITDEADETERKVLKTEKPFRMIKDLKNGEIGYTLPWALSAFRYGCLGINGEFPVDPKPRGTLSLRIRNLCGIVLVDKSTAEGDYKDPSSRWPPEECLPAVLIHEICVPNS
jgi:hypothetical protein